MALLAEAAAPERGRSFGLRFVGRPLVAWSAAAGLAVAGAPGLDMAAVGLPWRWRAFWWRAFCFSRRSPHAGARAQVWEEENGTPRTD